MADASVVRVTLACSPAPRVLREWPLVLAPGSTVADAISASGVLSEYPVLADAAIGVWGRKAAPSQLLREGDRVELYRALQVDPKVARRERFARQGTRGTGLFAKRRPGAKDGY